MISCQVYPVMDGLEVWIASSCMTHEVSHARHVGASMAGFCSREDIEKYGVVNALIRMWTEVLTEFPEITSRVEC